jgi:very-short-patch-repair endonuclease/transposase-like protein
LGGSTPLPPANYTYSISKLSKKYNKSFSTIRYWIRKYKLKTNHLKFTKGKSPTWELPEQNQSPRNNSQNWNEIQIFYDSGNTWSDIQNKYELSALSISKACKSGHFKSRTQSESIKLHNKKFGARKHNEETKKKISDYRIKYLTEHPDKVPYLINHSSKKSWPEQIFENALISSGITGWKYAHQNGIYEYDFAFIDKKIDVEIDGGTHKSEKVKKIDERRDIFSKSQGWKVIRFEALRVKKDVIGCINELKILLSND